MEKLFGLEMATIAGVLSGMLSLVIFGLALLAWRRPVFFKLGLRPIPRRRAQCRADRDQDEALRASDSSRKSALFQWLRSDSYLLI